MKTMTSPQHVSKRARLALFLCAGLMCVDAAVAQQIAGSAATQPLSDAQCLVRAVGPEGKKTAMAIIVPAAQAATMVKRGFSAVPCETAFASPKAAADWRNRVCTMASNPNEKVQDQLEKFLGERPNVLCGMAERVVGHWQITTKKSGSSSNSPSGSL